MSSLEEDPDVMAAAGMTIADDDDEDDDDDEYEEWNDLGRHPPPDGGFGWAIVVASLLCQVIVDGVCFSFGIFNVAFMEHFVGCSKSKMAWVGSLLAGFYLTLGPISSTLCNRYGFRSVTVAGSLLGCITFVASTYSTSVDMLIFTYGTLGGICFGLVYLPAVLIVGLWFEKHRALATGIAVCGSGIGAFVFAPLSRLLLNEYGVRGANWIIAGIILNGCVFGALFRPAETGRPRRPRRRTSLEDGRVKGLLQLMAKAKRDRKITLHGDDDIVNEMGEYAIIWGDENGKESGGVNIPRCNSVGRSGQATPVGIRSNRSFTVESTRSRERSVGSGSKPSLLISQSRPISLILKSNKSLDQTNSVSSRPATRPGSNKSLDQYQNESTRRFKISEVDITRGHNVFQPRRPRSTTRDFSGNPWDDVGGGGDGGGGDGGGGVDEDGDGVMSESIGVANVGGGDRRRSRGETDISLKKRQDRLESPSRRELYFVGSLNQIPYIGSRSDIKSNIASMISLHQAASRPNGINSQAQPGFRGLMSNAYATLMIMMDVTLFKSPVFVIICVSSFLSMTGFFIPFFYVPSYAGEINLGKAEGDFIIQVMGIANTVGRIGSGFIADLPCTDKLYFNSAALFIGGVATILVPFCTTYVSLIIYGVVFGLCIAIFISLRTPILADILGLERLASSFGLLSLFQGIATIIGAPMAGFVYDISQNYNATFYFAGSLMAISGAIFFPIRCIERCFSTKAAAANASATPADCSYAASTEDASRFRGSTAASTSGWTSVPKIVLEEPTADEEFEGLDENENVKEFLRRGDS